MEEKLSGIVLSGVSVGENDKILNIFTIEKGVISAKIKGVKKAGAKLKFASEPFCFAEYVFSSSLDKRTVIGASLIDSFYPLREDIVKFYSAGVILEFIKKFVKEESDSSELFFECISSLKELSYGKTESYSLLTKFLVNASELIGYALNLDGCFKCKKEITGRIFFEYSYGGFFCEDCHDNKGREINLKTFNALRKAEKSLAITKEEGVFALKLLDYYILNKTEEKLNSLSELIKILS